MFKLKADLIDKKEIFKLGSLIEGKDLEFDIKSEEEKPDEKIFKDFPNERFLSKSFSKESECIDF